MSELERLAAALAERFPQLDAPAMCHVPAFVSAAAAALRAVGSVEGVVREVGALGDLEGARRPHAVITARLRQVPALLADRARLLDEGAESKRWALVDRAAQRGESLRALVDAGQLYGDEAADMLRRELADPGLLGIAVAALEGGRR